MTAESREVIDKLGWLYLRDRRLLGARSRGKSAWYVPGGKRESGETDAQALVREIREELAVEIDPATLRYVAAFEAQADGKPDGVHVRVTCYRAEAAGAPTPSAEIEELRWLTFADRAACSPAAQRILDWLKAHELVD
jgi:8-oxo-dGTP pyrophosphatase MutT (NUDIX family)